MYPDHRTKKKNNLRLNDSENCKLEKLYNFVKISYQEKLYNFEKLVTCKYITQQRETH